MQRTFANGSNSLPVFFFDLDNCLYSQKHGISQLMGQRIQNYFANNLGLTQTDAQVLHNRYYKDYGLALQGLIKHHHIDPMKYNAEVDDSLPLEDCLKLDPDLRLFLDSMDRTKIRMWILTNAYINHAHRVLNLLGVADVFEGITYCDYNEGEQLTCKPYPEFYARAMQEAGVQDKNKCYFIDDSITNIEGALKFGWTESVHFKEPMTEEASTMPPNISRHKSKAEQRSQEVANIQELRDLYPQFFKPVPRNNQEIRG